MNNGCGLKLLVAVCGAVLVTAGGCEEVSLNTERSPRRPVRAAARPLVTASRPAAGAVGCETVCEPPEGKPLCYQQVVLLNEAPPPDPMPGLRYVRLTRAEAQDVGRALAWLYPPSGPAGGRSRYCLVYPSTMEADAAARVAVQLDVPPVGGGENPPIPPEGADAWALGVGLVYGATPDKPPGRQRVRRAEAALAQALADPKLTSARHWMAGMIAARAVSEYLSDYSAAERYFALAETRAQPGSLEQMSTWLARACNQLQAGEPQRARPLWDRIRAQQGPLRETEVFDRAGRALRDSERTR